MDGHLYIFVGSQNKGKERVPALCINYHEILTHLCKVKAVFSLVPQIAVCVVPEK
jgi:hypothetical protein